MGTGPRALHFPLLPDSRPCLAPEPFFLGCQQPLPRGKEKLQGQCGRNPKPGEQPGEGGGASWQRTPFQTPDPVLGARARDVLVQGVSWGALSGGGGPKATSLRTRRMDITRPILPSGPLFNTFPRTARVPKSNSLLSHIPRAPEARNIGYLNRAVYSAITKHLRGYSSTGGIRVSCFFRMILFS